MAGVRKALIVATDEYHDPKLTRLSAPATDARDLAEVLRDEAVGCFEVQTVLNRPSHEVELAIAEFFGSGRFGDTLLAHFSCHGVKSPSGELYFATTDTNLSDAFKLKVTGVPSALVRDAMEDSRASLILCLVDCCYSGAFVKLAKAADTVDLTERLGGKGRAVITASTSLQLALDGEEEPSLFTHAVIEGLRSGEADRDLDGLVSLDELYSFVHDRVTSRNPNQTPVRSFDVQGDVYVARRSTPVTQPAPLDADLLADARSLAKHRRRGAVNGLAEVLREGHPGRSLAARKELQRMAAEDDSMTVQADARAALDAAGEPPAQAPVIPDYQPTTITRGGPTVRPVPMQEEVDHPEPAQRESVRDQGEDGGRTRGAPSSRKRYVWTALGLVGALVVAGVVWQSLKSPATTSPTADPFPPLPLTDVLVGGATSQPGPGILAVDVATGSTRVVIHDPEARLPTISDDRRWLVYLTSTPGGRGVPHLARVDGSDDARLLDAKATKQCPYTTRPAFSPDGDSLAVVCLSKAGKVLGLGVVDREGNWSMARRDQGIQDAPTWTDDGRIVVETGPPGGPTTLSAVSSSDSNSKATAVTDGLDGSDTLPDWSSRGLLFLRTRTDGSNVYYQENLDTRGVTQVSFSGKVQDPTWGPADRPEVAWLQPAKGPHQVTLFVKTLGDQKATPVTTGDFGPPAWGSR